MPTAVTEKGLPIIPFAQFTFPLGTPPQYPATPPQQEEDCSPASRPALKSLKAAFSENRRRNNSVYNEEEEGGAGLPRREGAGRRVQRHSLCSQSSYLDMRANKFGEDPYMRMDDLAAAEPGMWRR